MKPASQTLLSVLGVSLLACGLLWKQQQEITELHNRIVAEAQELEQAKTEHAELDKKLETAEKKTHTLETALKLAAQPAETARPADTKRERAAANGGTVSEETLKQWMSDANDPAVMRRLNTEARNQILRRFADLLKQLNLPPQQNDALVKLLTDKRQVALDTAVASVQQGNDPTQDMEGYRDLMIANRDSIESQISSLLGPANYAQYQDNLRSTGQSNVVSNLQLSLSSTSEPLTPDQAAQIQQVMQDNNTARITAKVVADAKEILTPVQFQALEDLRAIQQANAKKRAQPVQVLPTSGAAPAPVTK